MANLFYPRETEAFQKFFLKLEAYDSVSRNKSNSIKSNGIQINSGSIKLDDTIYLPLPKGLLREDFQLDYSKQELGVLAEAVKEKYDNVKEQLKGITSGSAFANLSLGSAFDSTVEVGESIGQLGIDSLNTWLEQQVMKTDNIFFKIGSQALGYSRAPNFTLLFDGISRVREFVLEWKITPKNEEDAIELEKIIKTLQKSALPELADANYLGSLYELLIPTEADKKSETTEEQQNTKDAAKSTEPFAKTFYSSTFKIPKKFKISIMEKVGNKFNEVKYFMNFPHHFFIRDISTYYGVNSETETFIKGEQGYYHQSYEITLIMMESKLYTADSLGV